MHYKSEVDTQIQRMLDQGIIRESTSPWVAPAVYVIKRDGGIRICVDYRELNKRTVKDAYPLPLIDDMQSYLSGAVVFSTLDLNSGYWQLPINPDDRYKTAFTPGPGMGLYEFVCMPFGVCNGPSSFQRLMETVLRGMDTAKVFIDDILVFSPDIESHVNHLKEVFQRLRESKLTLRGSKCCLAKSSVRYLGYVFSAQGMKPDPSKVEAVQDWPTPKDVSDVRKFLGLASYYRKFIAGFSETASPLYSLLEKDVQFIWNNDCQDSFELLKSALSSSPVLIYPSLNKNFVLYTDASGVGVGAILEQDGNVISYASRTLTKSERNYSVIERECLALVYGTKQFRHYLLGRKFRIITDHKPLCWLSAQKMEGRLCRWALALQEFDFVVEYRSGLENVNADVLSRKGSDEVSLVCEFGPGIDKDRIKVSQENDPSLSTIINLLSKNLCPSDADQHLSQRYTQIWIQLKLIDGLLCREYDVEGFGVTRNVIVGPNELKETFLYHHHDLPCAGHQGWRKTLEKLKRVVYWVGMAADTQEYCKSCDNCMKAKQPMPPKLPMVSTQIGNPWHRIAVDVMEVPINSRGNKYLLVVQDYFTKWLEAFPMPDQKAERVVELLRSLFCRVGIPSVLHSDQGRNFESRLMADLCESFGVKKTHTTSYHPQGDGLVERSNRILLDMLRSYVAREEQWEDFLSLMLYSYNTSCHSSIETNPFTLMYGREPGPNGLDQEFGYDSLGYAKQLKERLQKYNNLVRNHLETASEKQKRFYDAHASRTVKFKVGDDIWLRIPYRGKLDPRWEGKWSVLEVLGEVNLKVKHQDGRSRVVHINRARPRFVRKDKFAGNQDFQLLSGYYNSIQDNETIPMNIQDTEGDNVQTEIPKTFSSS